jgi:hypothetical protein
MLVSFHIVVKNVPPRYLARDEDVDLCESRRIRRGPLFVRRQRPLVCLGIHECVFQIENTIQTAMIKSRISSLKQPPIPGLSSMFGYDVSSIRQIITSLCANLDVRFVMRCRFKRSAGFFKRSPCKSSRSFWSRFSAATAFLCETALLLVFPSRALASCSALAFYPLIT